MSGFWNDLKGFGGGLLQVAAPIAGSLIAGPAGAAIGAGAAGLGSLLSSSSDSHNAKEATKLQNTLVMQENDKNRKFNSDQAEITRLFNAAEAEKSRQFASAESKSSFEREKQAALEMWNKENEYNTPKAQLQRLMDAGLNPNLFGGQNTGGSIAAASSTPLSSSPASASPLGATSPLSYAPNSLVNPNFQASQMSLAASQARLNDAEARNLDANTNRTQTLLPYEVQTVEANVRFTDSRIKLTDKEREKIEAEIPKINKEVLQIEQNILTAWSQQIKLDKESQLIQKEIDAFEDNLAAHLWKTASECFLNYEEAKTCASTITKNLADAYTSGKLAGLYDAQTQNAKDVHILNGVSLSLARDKKYKYGEINIAYEEQSNRYNYTIQEGKNNEIEFEKNKGEFERWRDQNYRYQPWYNPMKYWNYTNERLGQFGTSVGSFVGGNVNYQTGERVHKIAK